MQVDRDEARLGRHEAGALDHQIEHLVLVVGWQLDGGDLGDDTAVLADIRHDRVLLLVASAGQRRGGKLVSGTQRRCAMASAIATVRRAISACRRSTMRPSSWITPLPRFSGSSKAAMILCACATSSAEGEKAALQGSIWLG